jgi:hypothetical protein
MSFLVQSMEKVEESEDNNMATARNIWFDVSV